MRDALRIMHGRYSATVRRHVLHAPRCLAAGQGTSAAVAAAPQEVEAAQPVAAQVQRRTWRRSGCELKDLYGGDASRLHLGRGSWRAKWLFSGRFRSVSGRGARTCGAAVVEAFSNGGAVRLSSVGVASTRVGRRERRRGVQMHFLQARGGSAGASEVEAFWDGGCGAWTPQCVAVALPGAQVQARGRESPIASPNEVSAAALFGTLLVWAGVSQVQGLGFRV